MDTPELEILESSRVGEWYFRLKATNGEVVYTSEMYDTEANAIRGALRAKELTAEAVIDLTLTQR